MAKKQKKELSPEERLAAARVPEEEWPYKLPEGWEWVRLIDGVAECLDSFRKPINAKERAERSGNVPYYGATGQVGWIDDFLTNEHLVLLGEDGAPFLDPMKNKAYIIEGKAWVNNHAHILRSYYGKTGNLYLMHYLNTFNFMGYVTGTTRLKLTQSNMNKIPVPLPPLEIQQQIVANIESLFAKLDQAKEKAQQTLATSDVRTPAILHRAITGELSEQWRYYNNVTIESWKTLTLNDCGEWSGGGTPSMQHSEYWEDGDILWVSSKDMKSNLIEDTLMHVNMMGVENSSAKYIEKPSLLFVTRSGILRRMLPIAMVKKPFTVNQDLKTLTPHEGINLDYLFWACRAKEREILSTCMKSGTTVESINFSALKQVEIPIPSLEEQEQIVWVLNFLLEGEDNFRKNIMEVIDNCDATKKSILAKAFRGEWK